MISKLRHIALRARGQGSWVRALKKALRNPKKACAFVRRTGSKRWLNALFDGDEFDRLKEELHDSALMHELSERLSGSFSGMTGCTTRGNSYTPGAMLEGQATLLYALIRKQKISTIVETGVCNGFSSAVILYALSLNGSGHLHSIDLPEFTGIDRNRHEFWVGKGGAVVPEDKESGWLVPAELRRRWTLHLGRSADILPKVLNEIEPIDLFVHDSEHSYENQLFEFRSAFASLRPGGIMFASDINWSDAFDLFAKEVGGLTSRYFVDYSLGLIIRRSE